MARKTRTKNGSKKKKEAELERQPAAPSHTDQTPYPFDDEDSLDKNKTFIECPGATVYDPATRKIVAGVAFVDESDPSAGYTIVDHPVYAPEHRKRRLVKKEDRNLIRRCQACQDLTVRLMRREGPDFFIPNPRFPRKKQLKPVQKSW